MSLEEYTKKRNVSRSKEPPALIEKPEAGLRFVVQKHAASHLHYDFRIELDGVLKSWAIPKGPSLDPSHKRLAMQVEDHPYEYRNFEGVIPPGNYGAGEVIIWDQGTYHAAGTQDRPASETAIRNGLGKGDIKFILHGQKLRGEFALVKIQRDARTGGKGNSWLLLKKHDAFATPEDITLKDRSVVSNETVEELKVQDPAHAPKAAMHQDRKDPPDPMPHHVAPMLATPVVNAFDDPDWIFEVKLDGYRAIAEIQQGAVSLYSRNDLPFTLKFPSIVSDLETIGHDAVLDGELVALDDNGRSDFQLLQNYSRHGMGTIAYFVFDLLYLDGRDLRRHTLLERKNMLRSMLPELDSVRYSDHVPGQGLALCDLARQNSLEGIIAKKVSSRYLTGRRSREWLKIKIKLRQEAIICGFTKPRKSRNYFGSLVLGVFEGRVLTFIGLCGGGFAEEDLRDVYNLLQPLVIPDSPFSAKVPAAMAVTWVRPQLVCEVSFTEWTGEKVMRHPVFLGLREDKEPATVIREIPELIVPVPEDEKERQERSRSVRGKVHFTNLDKIFWPEEGYTKGDVIDYYRRISDYILPYLKDRPESLYRTPHGITEKGFFQKETRNAVDPWIPTKQVFSESNDKNISYLLCQDQQTLLYMANLGCIEINPWLSRIENLNNPDHLVIDLDPEDISFEKVVEAALAVRQVLDTVGITAFPKTSGASGMHIYIPLAARYDYETAGTFAHLIAQLAHNLVPDFTSLVRSPSKRQNRVYLDYLQNRRGQTVAAPYSIRPRPGATVSTPLEWDEVKPGLNPGDFTIRTIHERLEKKGDLFRGILGEGVDLEACLKRLE